VGGGFFVFGLGGVVLGGVSFFFGSQSISAEFQIAQKAVFFLSSTVSVGGKGPSGSPTSTQVSRGLSSQSCLGTS